MLAYLFAFLFWGLFMVLNSDLIAVLLELYVKPVKLSSGSIVSHHTEGLSAILGFEIWWPTINLDKKTLKITVEKLQLIKDNSNKEEILRFFDKADNKRIKIISLDFYNYLSDNDCPVYIFKL